MQCCRCLQDLASFPCLLLVLCEFHERKHCPRRIDKLPLSAFFFLSTLKISFHAFSFSPSKSIPHAAHTYKNKFLSLFPEHTCVKCCKFSLHPVANATLLMHFHPDAIQASLIRVAEFLCSEVVSTHS